MSAEIELILTAPVKDMKQFSDILKSFKDDCNAEEKEILKGIIDELDRVVKEAQ